MPDPIFRLQRWFPGTSYEIRQALEIVARAERAEWRTCKEGYDVQEFEGLRLPVLVWDSHLLHAREIDLPPLLLDSLDWEPEIATTTREALEFIEKHPARDIAEVLADIPDADPA